MAHAELELTDAKEQRRAAIKRHESASAELGKCLVKSKLLLHLCFLEVLSKVELTVVYEKTHFSNGGVTCEQMDFTLDGNVLTT